MTTLATEADFLAAIAAAPTDDTPRLIYADWLDEQAGEVDTPRAEFIRVQCELAMREGYAGKDESGWSVELKQRMTELRRRGKELRENHNFGVIWFHPEIGVPPPDAIVSYRRGFVASITIRSADFMGHAADIIEAVPMLEEVRLSDKRPWNIGDGNWAFSHVEIGNDPLEKLWLLPEELYIGLPLDRPLSVGSCQWFRKESLAVQALSLSCLRYAREQLAQRHHRR